MKNLVLQRSEFETVQGINPAIKRGANRVFLYNALMEKTDARTLSVEAQEQLRKQAIRLKKREESFVAIAELLEVHRNAGSKWWKRYQNEGSKGLKSRQRGRREGDQRTLTPEQESKTQELIYDKSRINTNLFLRYGYVRPYRN